ncbi:MAG TPA: PA domain-containing protein [Flavobacterium sp.]|uniref:PA domain-containing protein n=1 Tax=Flavobacterium sp. TaxID=239 RepID=UPI002B4B599F|nr:PA domain-containing protein [Flavobacterium sp.]HLO73930.1 PA domain-containing protein [Flavobacterium sp.]
MKKQLLLLLSALFLFVTGYSQETSQQQKTQIDAVNMNEKEETNSNVKNVSNVSSKPDKKTKKLRKLHEKHLANSPFKKTLQMSKSERKAAGIPPNKYLEQEWELTMNPQTGKVDIENLRVIRDNLSRERAQAIALGRTPGDGSDNSWVERGPNNVGGRTRAIIFDPNDPTYNTVIAGGVSGGLWKNTNISSSSSTWTRINIPENLNVSSITYDPNNTNIFYAGTGESYVFGDVSGDGLWKSSDAGLTWTKVFGGITGNTFFQSSSSLTINAPSGIAGSYPVVPTTAFGTALSSSLTNDIVLISDDTPPTSDGCDGILNGAALNGKIALIRRGSCTFVIKVKAAQDAGAVAVIVMNNVAGAGPASMGGTDPTITIPSFAVSKETGDMLEAALASNTVNGTLNTPATGVPSGFIVPGIQHINDVVVKNNGGSSEIYVAAGDTFYSSSANATYQGSTTYGVYKSTDGGSNWTLLNLPLTVNGNKHCPNDIEIGVDGTIWVSTTNSWSFGDGGGKIFSSTDGGNTFVDKYTVTNGARTEIEVSNTTANKLYVLSEIDAVAPSTIEITMLVTNNGFSTAPTVLTLPTGNETREITYGFTGQQAFYDLMIESDPSNDQILYVGGIDLYRSTDGANSWVTISDWTSNVHADQHAMAFKPNNSNIAIFGNDGGVYYSGNLSATGTPATSRNNGFNVTQFHSVAVAPTGATGGNLVNDYFSAGAQDNGTNYFASVGPGINPSVESQGGDGGTTVFDQGADKYYISSYVYNVNINYRSTAGNVRAISNDAGSAANGAFYPAMALDSGLDILYTDYSSGTSYIVRRYTNLKSGIVGRTSITNALLTGSPTALKVSPYTSGSSTLLVGTKNGKLLRVTGINNTTGTWTDITGSGFVGSISDVEYGLSNDEIFVTVHNYGVTSIWYTSNGTSATPTWLNKEGNLPDLPVKCILQNPLNTNEVIIGTDLGVWYTNNFTASSPTWNQSYNGMSNVKVPDMDLRNDNKVFAATYGRGVFSGSFTAVSLSNDDIALNNEVKIYPNPSKGMINISIPSYSGELKVNLFDINGREVLSSAENFSIEKSINLKGLESGIYVLKLQGNDGLSYTEKIVLE